MFYPSLWSSLASALSSMTPSAVPKSSFPSSPPSNSIDLVDLPSLPRQGCSMPQAALRVEVSFEQPPGSFPFTTTTRSAPLALAPGLPSQRYSSAYPDCLDAGVPARRRQRRRPCCDTRGLASQVSARIPPPREMLTESPSASPSARSAPPALGSPPRRAHGRECPRRSGGGGGKCILAQEPVCREGASAQEVSSLSWALRICLRCATSADGQTMRSC